MRPFEPLDLGLNYDPRQPDRLSITLNDGTEHVAEIDYPLGAPQRPMTFDDILTKFRGVTNATNDQAAAIAAWPDCDDLHDLLKPWSANK